MTFRYHSSDINSVSFFPDGNSIGTGSDDHTCHVLDMRSCQSLGCYGNDKILCGITSGNIYIYFIIIYLFSL